MNGIIRSLLERIVQQKSSLADPVLAVWRQQKSQSNESLATFWTESAQLKKVLIATMKYGTARYKSDLASISMGWTNVRSTISHSIKISPPFWNPWWPPTLGFVFRVDRHSRCRRYFEIYQH